MCAGRSERRQTVLTGNGGREIARDRLGLFDAPEACSDFDELFLKCVVDIKLEALIFGLAGHFLDFVSQRRKLLFDFMFLGRHRYVSIIVAGALPERGELGGVASDAMRGPTPGCSRCRSVEI